MATSKTPKADSAIELTFEFEKSTKNTHRFSEVGDENIVGSLYVAKRAFKGDVPASLTVTIVPA